MRRFLVAATFAAVLTAGHAQPPPVPPTYTAFPDLKTPTRPVDLGDGKTGAFPDFPALHARLRAAADRPLAPDAAPAAKVRSFRLQAGVDYLLRVHLSRCAIGRCFMPSELVELTGMVNDVYQAAVEGEADPTTRVALVEERVRVLKELERYTEAQVNAGQEVPYRLAFIRFHRLGAEGELLKRTERK